MEQVHRVFERLLMRLQDQQIQCENIDSWLDSSATGFRVPRNAKSDHLQLAKFSRTPWLKLVVDNVVQAMYVDNIFTSAGPSAELWGAWMENGLPAAQIANHRAMFAYGHSYGVVERSENGRRPVVRFVSPRRCAVEFDQPGDWYPSAALLLMGGGGSGRYKLFAFGKSFRVIQGAQSLEFEELAVHEVVPVVRFANQTDLEGSVVGEVEPFIPTARRINKTAFDRLLAQHYNSWKVKTATGIELPDEVDEDGEPTGAVDARGAEKLKVKLSNEDVLIAESEAAKFGTLDATALEPFIAAWRSDVEALAAVSQTPAHALTGQMVNLSAEALAAARAPLTQKVYERQMTAGVAYANLLRLMAGVLGLEAAVDHRVRVSWQDVEIRSLSQAVDALGKAASMLSIPAAGLWRFIPSVERSDIEEWERMRADELESDPLRRIAQRHVERVV